MENNLQKKRAQLGLTIGELSDQQDVQSNTITSLENNVGVNREKPRAMRMLINLGVPYKMNERGSIFVDDRLPLRSTEGVNKSMVFEEKYYQGLNLGNGLLQQPDGNVYYNELRDAISQSELEIEEFAEMYSIPISRLADIASGRRALKDSIDVIDMLDELNIKYSYNSDDSLYITRHFKVTNDEELARYLSDSLYLKRTKDLPAHSGLTASVAEQPLTRAVPEEQPVQPPKVELIMPSPVVERPVVVDPVEEDAFLLDIVKSDLKKVLQSYDWSQEENSVLKQAYQTIAYRQVREEVDAL